MRFSSLLTSASLIAAGYSLMAFAWAEELPQVAMIPELKTCIEANAASVEALGEALGQSIDLLTSKVCAVEAAAQGQIRWEAQQAAWKKRVEDRCARAKAAEPTIPPRPEAVVCEDPNVGEMFDAPGTYLLMEAQVQYLPAEAIALAAQKLIELRTKRLSAVPK